MCPYCSCLVGICDELQSRESEMGRKCLISLISSGIAIVLSFPTGHASALLYTMLYLSGYDVEIFIWW